MWVLVKGINITVNITAIPFSMIRGCYCITSLYTGFGTAEMFDECSLGLHTILIIGRSVEIDFGHTDSVQSCRLLHKIRW